MLERTYVMNLVMPTRRVVLAASLCSAALWVKLLLWTCLALVQAPAHAGGPAWVTPAVTAPRVSQHSFHSTTLGAPVSYHVYLPAAYTAQPERRFPVLYWLHGSNSVLTGIAPVSALFDAAISAGQLPPLIVVFANGLPYGMWCNAESGLQPVEAVLIDDLLPEVDARFRTISQSGARLLEGFSMGGYGAARLALLYPQHFGAASMLGAGPLQLDFLVDDPNLQPIEVRRRILAEVYGNSPEVFEARSPWRIAQQYPPAAGYRLRQVVGTADFTLGPNRDFQVHLDTLGVYHVYTEVPGVGHSVPSIVAALGDSFWAFHRDALREFDGTFRDGFE